MKRFTSVKTKRIFLNNAIYKGKNKRWTSIAFVFKKWYISGAKRMELWGFEKVVVLLHP
jgi:hypothetical protein